LRVNRGAGGERRRGTQGDQDLVHGRLLETGDWSFRCLQRAPRATNLRNERSASRFCS
jgi:hypothetical protein